MCTACHEEACQIIEKNPTANVQVLNPPAVNPMLQWQIGFAKEMIQNIGSQQDASMGRVPSASASGDLVEALQQGDANTLFDLRDNFEDALAMEAQWVLKMYSLFEAEGVVMSSRVSDEEEETFAVVGQQALKKTEKKMGRYYSEDNGEYYDVCEILSDNQVKVSVTSQLGETRQARLELLMKLVELGVPLKVLLEHLEFPNVSDIYERIGQEALGDIALQQMQSAATQPPLDPGMMPPGGPPPPGGVPAGPPPPVADQPK